VAELRPRVQEIRQAGGDLVVVGSGAPMFLDGFRELLGLDEEPRVEVYTDPSLASYKLLGFKRGVFSTFDPRSAAPYARALTSGHKQGRTQGDSFQQGGVVVIRPDGSMPFHFASAYGGDHPPPDEVVEAVRRAVGG
jgi:hypothetical protein